ncbi:MAG: DUF721 domain-containing protein [Bacteroidota bacterium]|nr:DUF721 domain-containing protein [Bacteroidota bacterium]
MARYSSKRVDRYRKSTPKPISEIIGKVIHDLGLGSRIKEYEIIDLWSRIVGNQIAKVTSAESIRDGKLIVRVKHPTWRNELLFLKRGIIEKINKEMNQEIIKDIYFK